MSNDIVTRNTGKSKRTSAKVIYDEFGSGPFLAIVRNHLDTTYNGNLEVEMLTRTKSGNSSNTPGQLVPVSYLSPFYGTTPYIGTSKNQGHTNSQQSYGFWAVPPDVGSQVLVIFTPDGYGFWMGCVQEENMNMCMLDNFVSTSYNDQTSADIKPVVEYNKRIETARGRDATQFVKPTNLDSLNVLETQGLNKDLTRGLTTTSPRRNLPSSVYGLTSPGPQDKRSGAPKVKYGEKFAETVTWHNRLGGTNFVIDDGDPTLLRKKPASEAPPEYVNIEKGETGGDPTLLHNELTRIRTRTGHQLLFHNTEDLIYIGNARGTSWVELSSNGKIDIYAEDSISIHSKNDINLNADRDINIEAGRNFNVKANNDITFESIANYQLIVGENNKITTVGNYDVETTGNKLETTKGDFDLKTTGHNWFTAGGPTDIKSGGNHTETAPQIHMNGPTAATAATATPAQALPVFELPADGEETIETIMKRVPQHEPWLHHENLDPAKYTPSKTDITTTDPVETAEYKQVHDTFRKTKN